MDSLCFAAPVFFHIVRGFSREVTVPEATDLLPEGVPSFAKVDMLTQTTLS